MTSGVKEIVEQVRGMGRIDGLINNSHLGDETTAEVVQNGARVVSEAAGLLGLPVIATAAAAAVAEKIGPADCMGNPVRPLERFMPRAFW
jgi:basic membrane lipoprotein Med (substrate-binding protein (PBP1-ABC) superfamily)